MKTSKETAERILSLIQKVADARIRPMMGEYLVYVNDKVAGQINHNDLFIKITAFGESFASDLKRDSPYDGAKPAFIVPQEKITDEAWLREFIAGTAEQLPSPKK